MHFTSSTTGGLSGSQSSSQSSNYTREAMDPIAGQSHTHTHTLIFKQAGCVSAVGHVCGQSCCCGNSLLVPSPVSSGSVLGICHVSPSCAIMRVPVQSASEPAPTSSDDPPAGFCLFRSKSCGLKEQSQFNSSELF